MTLPCLANAIRLLTARAVAKAKSGHLGMPLGMAEIAEVLWSEFLKVNPNNPRWQNRDRFILSNGHGSMLHYALLHLCGFDMSKTDIEAFRQMHSKTPGHPEVETDGIETTTGPLGQGFANAVGMALAEKMSHTKFKVNDFSPIDYRTYVFVGDGCLMEGVSAEAASLAGHWQLDKLICCYDDNQVTIDTYTDATFTEDVTARFEALGWECMQADGTDREQIRECFTKALTSTSNKPKFIKFRTKIGHGTSVVSSPPAHGVPATDYVKEVEDYVQSCGEDVEVSQDVLHRYDLSEKGAKLEAQWQQKLTRYQQENNEITSKYQLFASAPDYTQFDKELASYMRTATEAKASREWSKQVLELVVKHMPNVVCGSADLAGSTGVNVSSTEVWPDQIEGRRLHFGVREHAMAAIANGLTLANLRPCVSTFLVFADYMKPAIRMASIMSVPSIFIFTHDSLGVGEDGPTHQPVDQLEMLRNIPNLDVVRPANMNETALVWQQALKNNKPTAMVYSRQKLELTQIATAYDPSKGYSVIRDCKDAEIVLAASGSEVALAAATANKLAQDGVNVRVLSAPNLNAFVHWVKNSNSEVWNWQIPHLVIEASTATTWHKIMHPYKDALVSVSKFGFSAPGAQVLSEFGFEVESILEKAKSLL